MYRVLRDSQGEEKPQLDPPAQMIYPHRHTQDQTGPKTVTADAVTYGFSSDIQWQSNKTARSLAVTTMPTTSLDD